MSVPTIRLRTYIFWHGFGDRKVLHGGGPHGVSGKRMGIVLRTMHGTGRFPHPGGCSTASSERIFPSSDLEQRSFEIRQTREDDAVTVTVIIAM